MRVSEVTTEFASEYCGISDVGESVRVELCMSAAKAYIQSNIGLSAEDVDEHEDITIAYLTLVNEMYNNRDYTVEKAAKNPLIEQILAMHPKNLL